MKKNKIFGIFLTVIAIPVVIIAFDSGSFNPASAECKHGSVEEHNALAPTLSREGLMHHYACCDCHAAFQDETYKIQLSVNTTTDRDKLSITRKTAINPIDKSYVSNDDDIILVNENHVYGLDQTNWMSTQSGIGSGNVEYYSLDSKKALRISTEELDANHFASLDDNYYGYSEIAFSKRLTGTITMKFDYKLYDLNTDKFNNESKVQAVWYSEDGYKRTSDMELITDNKWHTVVVSSPVKMTTNDIAFKIHHFDGEMYISNLSLTSTGLDFPILFREGGSVKWESVPNADYYIVNDSNNNPNEIRVEASSASENILTYKPTAAGKHNIYVTAYDSDGVYDPSISNVVEGIEVDPVFFYDNMINKYYINDSYLSDGNSDSSDKALVSNWGHEDGKYYAWYTNNGTYTTNENERLRFNTTDSNGNLARIVREAKELGTNVLHVSHQDGYLGNQTLESNQELKTIMDYAHANNLKVTIMSNVIYAASVNGPSEATVRSQVQGYLKAYGKTLLEHPAFYGFALRDEPPREGYGELQSVEYVSWTARAVLDYYAENYGSINFSCERPFFVCALLQYGGTNIFHCEYDYENYVETWLRITGLDYFSTDIYTYTTQQKYGDNPEGIDINYNILMQLKKRYKNLKMHLTITSNNDVYERASCNQYDIFGSTLYAAAMNNYGVSRYTYYPAMDTYHWSNGVVNRDGSHTSKYEWIKQAQAQYEFIHDKLYDYYPIDASYVTDGEYGQKESWLSSKERTNTRRMDITLSNGTYEATMIVNYNSQADKVSTFSVTIPTGKLYYKFGMGETSTEYISTGGSVSLTNGTAVLIMDASEKQVLANINELIETANNLNTDTKQAKAQFTLLGDKINSLYSNLDSGMKARVKNYSEFSEKSNTISKGVSILYNGGYNYLEGENQLEFYDNSDPMFGNMQTYEWPETKSGNIQLCLDTFLVGEDWSIYKSVGLFMRFSHAPTDNTFLIVNNWSQDWVPATKTLIDESTNLYFYEFDMSSVTGPFTANTYFQVYFNPSEGDVTPVNMTKMEVSNLVKFTHDTSAIDMLIDNALTLSTTSNRDLTQFVLLANRIDLSIATLGNEGYKLISRYDEYVQRKSVVSNKAIMIDNGSNITTHEPGVSGDWPYVKNNAVASDYYGYFNSHTYGSIKNGGNCQVFYQGARGNSWKSYSKIGFFVQTDSPLYHQAYLHDGAKNLYADPQVVDATNHIYYVEINITTVVDTFSGNPFICINLGGGAYTQTLNITNVVGIY